MHTLQINNINRKTVIELLFVCIITVLFISINTFNLKSWYFSVIGDEYSFFTYAYNIAKGYSKPNIFSEKGVFDVIPVMSSYYQAFIMSIVGKNVIGWKFSQILLVALTIIPFYALTKKLFNRTIAALTTIIYSSSHVIWAYVHTGYSNIESLFPFIYSLTFLVYKYYFLAGLFAGLSLYTYYTSRIVIILIFLWFIIAHKTIKFPMAHIKFVAGFIVLFIPYILVNKSHFIINMMNRSSVSQKDPSAYGPWYKFLFDNIIKNTVAPWYNAHNQAYVSGSLVDIVTGCFLLVGIIFALRFIRQRSYQFACCLYFIPLLVITITSPYSYTVISRYHIVIPGIAVLSAIGLYKLAVLIPDLKFRRIAFIFFGVFIIFLNLYRFFYESPHIFTSTTEAEIIRQLSRPSCIHTKDVVIIGSANNSPNNVVRLALQAYELNNNITLVEYKDRNLMNINKENRCVLQMKQ